jgi:probable rRNA maturation factor
MAEIYCKNLNPKRRVSIAKITKAAEAVLVDRGKQNVELNIVVVSNQKIRAINRQFLKKDNVTDVIAFGNDGAGGGFLDKDFLGDIAISSDRAYKNAKLYGVSFDEEVMLYVIHGILHLTGYDDMTEKKRARMKIKEKELLEKIK